MAVILTAVAVLPPGMRGVQHPASTQVAQAGATGSAAAHRQTSASRSKTARPAAARSASSSASAALPTSDPTRPNTGPDTSRADRADRAKEPSAPVLRIGVVAPSPDVINAVGTAVGAADGHGQRVSMVMLNPADVANADVDAVVGGTTPPRAGTPWLLPADPHANGPNVVRAELDAAGAGAMLADGLVEHGLRGRVGVVVQPGPDARLADGVESRLPVTRVDGPAGTDCTSEVSALRFSGVVALAVAGPPELAKACVTAAWSAGLPVPGGIMLAPSAAYGGVAFSGTRTVLGLPWPNDTSAGATRFRSATGSTTYPALLAFAATEVAVAMSHSTGSLSSAARTGTWQTDLVDIQRGANAGAAVVMARNGAWFRESHQERSGHEDDNGVRAR